MSEELDFNSDIDNARALISALARDGQSAFRMSIPPQAGDSDMLLSRIVDAAEEHEKAARYGEWKARIAVLFLDMTAFGAAMQVLQEDEPWRKWFDEGLSPEAAVDAEMEAEQ